MSHILPFDFKCQFVQRRACECVRVSKYARSELKAGICNDGEGVTHFLLSQVLRFSGVYIAGEKCK